MVASWVAGRSLSSTSALQSSTPSLILRTQLCCTLFEIACFDSHSPPHHEFSSSLEKFIAEHIASRESEWFPCRSGDLHSLSQMLAEVQTKLIDLEQRIDGFQISAGNATAATDHRVDALQSSTETATRPAVSELRRLEHNLLQCYALLNEFAQFLNQQPSNQQLQFQHSQFPPQHPHPQPASSSYPPHAPWKNQLPAHFPPQQPPLQVPPFDPLMNQANPMNAMNPRTLAFDILGRRVERLRKLIRLFSGKPGSGEFPNWKEDLMRP